MALSSTAAGKPVGVVCCDRNVFQQVMSCAAVTAAVSDVKLLVYAVAVEAAVRDRATSAHGCFCYRHTCGAWRQTKA